MGGCVTACVPGGDDKPEPHMAGNGLLSKKSESKDEDSDDDAFFVSFCEICSEDTSFQLTKISTESDDNRLAINETENMVAKALYKCGKRITGATKVNASASDFYVLVHKRNPSENLDECQIHKYKLVKGDNNDEDKIGIEFVEETATLFKDEGVNAEGIAVIADDDGKVNGFLVVNDEYCKPAKNTNLYYVNDKMESKILHSLDDGGCAEWSDICKMNVFGKNGFLILPQALNLGGLVDGKKDWTEFETWIVSNEGKATMLFVDRESVLKGEPTFEEIGVYLDNADSKESCFYKFGDKSKGYVQEGFEAVTFDDGNNLMFTVECSKDEDTFNFLMCGRMVKNEETEVLEVHINPCKYKKIENNGGGSNYGQEGILYFKDQ